MAEDEVTQNNTLPKKKQVIEKKITVQIIEGEDFLSTEAADKLHAKLTENKNHGKSAKGVPVGRNSGGANIIYKKLIYKIPIIGSLLLKKKIREGYFCADILFKNQQVQRFVVDSSSMTLEIEQKSGVRFFNLSPAAQDNNKYIKREKDIPIISFFWEYPNPIPVKPTAADIIDLGLFGDEVLRQRSKAAAQPIRDFLAGTVDTIKRVQMLTLASVATNVIVLAKLFGYI